MIDDLALVVSPTNGAIATVNSMANAGGDIIITGGTATTTTVSVANDTATKTVAITADVATTSLNGISMIGNNTTLQAGPGTSALTMGITTDTAARTITFTVNGTALPAAHASTHAPGETDTIYPAGTIGQYLQLASSASVTWADIVGFSDEDKMMIIMGGMF